MKGKLFILKATRYGESDLIIRVLDRLGSKFSLIARSAMKSRKRFGGGVLEPTHLALCEYEMGREDSSLGTLKEAQLLEGFEGIRADYERLQLALHMVTLVDRVSREAAQDSEHLFDLLGHGLRSTETTTRLSLLRVQFELKLLSHQGVLPSVPGADELLTTPLRDHSKINCSEEQLSGIAAQLRPQLNQYLV